VKDAQGELPSSSAAESPNMEVEAVGLEVLGALGCADESAESKSEDLVVLVVPVPRAGGPS
jgi:hypothetical protein